MDEKINSLLQERKELEEKLEKLREKMEKVRKSEAFLALEALDKELYELKWELHELELRGTYWIIGTLEHTKDLSKKELKEQMRKIEERLEKQRRKLEEQRRKLEEKKEELKRNEAVLMFKELYEEEQVLLRKKNENIGEEEVIQCEKMVKDILFSDKCYPFDGKIYKINVRSFDSSHGVGSSTKYEKVPGKVMALMQLGILSRPYSWDRTESFSDDIRDRYTYGENVIIHYDDINVYEQQKLNSKLREIRELYKEEDLDKKVKISRKGRFSRNWNLENFNDWYNSYGSEIDTITFEVSVRELINAGIDPLYFDITPEFFKGKSKVTSKGIVLAEQKVSLSRRMIDSVKGLFDKLKSKGKEDIQR